MLSFTGNLEFLPIVDVMQLLHQTRKSGILRVKGRKGESQLVFKDGYMVSANHLNNSVRIGKILIDLNIITPDILDKALQMQGNAGAERKPLIITLINQGLVNEKDAYKGLEHLIEMAVVEILTWKKGSFSLEAAPTTGNDFRFYPGKLVREINVDTLRVLMDALRIFDEKKRDGELTDEELPEDEPFAGAAMVMEDHESRPTGKVRKREIPPQGSLVSCPRCKSAFHVGNPVVVWSPHMMSVCPACQYSTFGTGMFTVCPQCGLGHGDPLPVRHVGWGYSALGVALLCYGLYGLASYYSNDWQAILSEDRLVPISKLEIFFRLGFLPWLFTLFGSTLLAAAGRFLLMRDHARKEMQMAAWAGVGVCAAYETAEFISWVRMFSSPSLLYCAAGLASSLLMTALWSLPFLALLWYLQSEAIVRQFPE